MIPQLFSIRHWWKLWFCTNNPIRVIPWHHNFLQHFCTMIEIIFIIFLLLLIPWRLNNTEPYHNPRPTACRILGLHPILLIHVHFRIHWQTQIDPMTSLSVPLQYGLISTYEIRGREYLCVILIKRINEVFNEFPLMILMYCTLTSHIWLMAPSNMPPQHIETVPIHAGFSKTRSRPVI